MRLIGAGHFMTRLMLIIRSRHFMVELAMIIRGRYFMVGLAMGFIGCRYFMTMCRNFITVLVMVTVVLMRERRWARPGEAASTKLSSVIIKVTWVIIMGHRNLHFIC